MNGNDLVNGIAAQMVVPVLILIAACVAIGAAIAFGLMAIF